MQIRVRRRPGGASGGLASGRGEWRQTRKFEWIGTEDRQRAIYLARDVRTAYRSAFGGVAGTGLPKEE